MGIISEIQISSKERNGAYTPGNTITGIVKYTIDNDSVFKEIVLSLKGKGYQKLSQRVRRPGQQPNRTEWSHKTEDYLNLQHVILMQREPVTIPAGTYISNFSFQLPPFIPPSFRHEKHDTKSVSCKIHYYISLKFTPPLVSMKFTKIFKKKLTVASNLRPMLPSGVISCEEMKKLFKPFSRRRNIIKLSVSINSNVIKPNGEIELSYEIVNDSNTVIKDIKTKVVEILDFKGNWGIMVEDTPTVIGTKYKLNPLQTGDIFSGVFKINLPSDIKNIEYTRLVMNSYILLFTVVLPVPHQNMLLRIPLKAGDVHALQTVVVQEAVYDVQDTRDAPPSYWEAMREGKDDDSIDDIDDFVTK